MLVLVDDKRGGTPEDVDADLSLVSDVADQGFESVWFGQPLRVRAMLRTGVRLSLGLSMSECASLYLLLHGDRNVRAWADMMEARATAAGGSPRERPDR